MSVIQGSRVAGGDGYQIQRSLRFRASAGAYLNRTFVTPTDQKKFTYSAWIKRGALGGIQNLLQCGGVGGSTLYINSDDTLHLSLTIGAAETRVPSQVFRDPGAHFHLMLVLDTTQATATDRVKMYVNGSQVTSFSVSNAPGLNSTFSFNSAAIHYFGLQTANVAGYFDGYVAEKCWIDGQALTPSSFGEINPTTGQWVAKKYTGTYGTNGFYLPFDDITSTTTLGYDKSGNGNNWTPSGISLTAGITYDSMLDVPAGNAWDDGGNGRGNYVTLSPLAKLFGTPLLSDGNLRLTTSGGGVAGATVAYPTTGKWYIETTVLGAGSTVAVGICNQSPSRTAEISYQNNGNKNAGGAASAYGATYTTNDIIGMAVDCDASTVTFYKNNVSQGALNLSLSSLTPADIVYQSYVLTASDSVAVNFGQRPFAYTPPAGFKALHTGNLTSDTVTVSGSFTGNASADGPFVWCNGTPETLTINGNAVTFATHADRLANGFKLRTASASYNAAGTNTWTATILSPSLKSSFRNQNAKGNP